MGDVNGDGRDDIVASDAISLGIGSDVRYSDSQDLVLQFGGLNSANVTSALNTAGIGGTNSASETVISTFIVPGTLGTNVNLDFKLDVESGDFSFSFGFYDISAVTANPITQKQTYATQAIGNSVSNGWTVFDEYSPTIDTDGATRTIANVPAGTELGFYIVPNARQSDFLANPSSYYSGSANPNFVSLGAFYSPLFSFADANPGQKDQMLSFVGNGKTLLAFDDIARTSTASDQDFDDLVFSINTPLVVTDRVEPQTLGDVNGDGFDDVAYRNSGKLQIVYGKAVASQMTFATPNVSISGFSGYSLSTSAGDFNADGHADLAVLDTSVDKVYVFL